ncbi:MAG: glutamate-5-semialdehyde dehydrogenase [Candidatus Nitrohelix vancouverensis]|uniref:Gamma-glutamyl phosphate reductase n=1 Tax=Candidatus Nitrohelix vancouverensis TaxID=2705534 RepID=A0A7T0G436_9BACT|nr:MAG: glutamate-5-semialdehyde dehydrogenase [Candidatus Nitrohelix vancouverensis]
MNDQTVEGIAKAAQQAALKMARLSSTQKNQVLESMACSIENHIPAILEANEKDLDWARQENIEAPLISRLELSEGKIRGMAQGIRSVAALPDPVGLKLNAMELDEGLILTRLTCPIGVIAAIFESRPDAVPQIASLGFKSGNAVILKGGREAQNSNKIIGSLLQQAIRSVSDMPEDAVQLIETRSEVEELLKQDACINLIVPRGSNDFVRYIQENTKIPVLGHSEGICHAFIDSEADDSKAIEIVLDSKLQYPAACNAIENLLIHSSKAESLLPELVTRFKEKGVELVGCERAQKAGIAACRPEDWDTEYTGLKLSIKVVDSLDDAIDFINCHGSGHTDVIITENESSAEKFMEKVDSASVMWNASTRFADGFRYGLGAEIGISTNKTHARGPVGLEGLIIYKYQLRGKGQTVAQYSGENARSFTHRPIE